MVEEDYSIVNKKIARVEEMYESLDKDGYFVYMYMDPRIQGEYMYDFPEIKGKVFRCEPFYIGIGNKYRALSHIREMYKAVQRCGISEDDRKLRPQMFDERTKHGKINTMLLDGVFPVIDLIIDSSRVDTTVDRSMYTRGPHAKRCEGVIPMESVEHHLLLTIGTIVDGTGPLTNVKGTKSGHPDYLPYGPSCRYYDDKTKTYRHQPNTNEIKF